MNFFAIRIVATMLTFFCTLLGIGACGAQVFTTQTAQNPVFDIPLGGSGEPTAMHILSSRGETGYLLQQAADLYMESHPGVRISVQTIGSEEEYRLALRQRLESGAPCDLFHLAGRRDAWELRKYLRDLGGLGWVDQAVADLAEPMFFDDGYYGVPYSVEGCGLIANRNMFEAAGIPLRGINSYADLEGALTELQSMIEAGGLEESFPDLEAVTELAAQDKAFLADTLAPIALTGDFPGAAHIAGTEYIRMPHKDAVGSLFDLLARCSVSGKRTEKLLEVPQNLQVELGLAAGRVAVIPQSVNICRRVERVNERLAERLALLPVPLEGSDQAGVYVGTPAYWAVSAGASSENARVAIGFLTWLYRSEEGAAFMAENMRILSPYRDTAGDTGSSLHSQLLDYIAAGRYLPAFTGDYPPGWAGGVFTAGLQEYFAGELDWEEFAVRCCEQWYSARKK